jgi:hypothetical protein
MTAYAKALGIWALMALFAILNGILREKVLVPLFGQPQADPLSGISLSLLIFLLSWLSVPWLGTLASHEYWLVGGLWLVMTLLFEFVFGRLVAGKTWDELLRAYDFTTGNLWALVLVVMVISPYLAARLRGQLYLYID